MTDAREIITSAIDDLYPNDRLRPLSAAIRIMRKLSEQGFLILGPDDWRDVQRVVEIANRNEASPEGARLARALKEKRT